MSSKLMIRLYPSREGVEASVDWLLIGSDGMARLGSGLLSDIPGPFENCSVIVLVPSADVLSFQIALPRMKMARLKKMVPFAIEEYLATDLSDLHLAISGFNADGKLLVGVVQHERMKAWLHQLRMAGIAPDVMVPDFWYFPCEQQVWPIWVESDSIWVKTGEDQGFPADIKNLKILIDLKLKEFAQEGKPLPEKMALIFSDHSLRENLSKEFENNIDFQLDISESSSSLLSILSDHLPEKQIFNLLQAPYEVKRKWGKLKKQWFPIALLLIIWLCFFLFKETFEYFYLKRQNIRLEQETFSLYKQIFPSVKDTATLKTQLQRLLDQTFKVARGDPFLKRLSQVAALMKTSSVVLTGFDYRDQTLTLKVEARDFQAFNALIQLFKQQGILVEQKHTTQEVQGVVSQWVIKK